MHHGDEPHHRDRARADDTAGCLLDRHQVLRVNGSPHQPAPARQLIEQRLRHVRPAADRASAGTISMVYTGPASCASTAA